MSSPFFSIVIPVYNVEKYLHQCVDSILNQSFTDFEVILVDDGSPDNCPQICDYYAQKDPRVKVIHKPNGGVSSARNIGIDAARSEFILFCDSDDYYLEGALEKIANMTQSANADVYCFGIRKETQKGTVDITSAKYKGTISDELLLSLAYAGLVTSKVTTINVSPINKVYRKSVIDKFHLRFDETLRIAEDISFNVAYFSKCNTVVCLDEALYFYRMNLNSAIHVDKGFAEKGMERSVYFLSNIQRNLEHRISKVKLYPVAKNRYNRLVIDACCNQFKKRVSMGEMLQFVKKCLVWYRKYLAHYAVELTGTSVVGTKAKMEDFMIRHNCRVLLCLYSGMVSLYHNM